VAKKSSDIVEIRYVGPHDVIEIAATGATCRRGGTVEVAAWIAGEPPSEESPGSGLLAQADNWQPVAASSTEADAPLGDNPKE
jgi:hypothetical protein